MSKIPVGIKEDLKPEHVVKILVNPFYAINIDPNMCHPHEPLVSRDEWIKSGVQLIGEIGAEAFLTELLNVLEGEYVVSTSEVENDD